jgi:DNA adenine methylase
LIYCDIPYKDTKQYATSKDFDYDKFFDWCRGMSKEGHSIFVSEYQAPPDFKCVWEKELTNSMNQTKTYKPIEKLFTLE